MDLQKQPLITYLNACNKNIKIKSNLNLFLGAVNTNGYRFTNGVKNINKAIDVKKTRFKILNTYKQLMDQKFNFIEKYYNDLENSLKNLDKNLLLKITNYILKN